MFRYYNGGFKTVSQIAYEAFVEADEAKEAVDNLEIGGRNYVLNSDTESSGTADLIGRYALSEPMTADEEYTISLSLSMEDLSRITVRTSGGDQVLATIRLDDVTLQTVKATFTAAYASGKTPDDDPNNADIPMQKLACREYAATHADWEIIDEISEKGVSGYKVSTNARDAIVEIKKRALLHQFDVLLVFMFDRIGRRDDETPFVVQWFVQQGIEVWSAREGEQRFDNHVDKLLNYIRFWQASGESEKTSIRVKTKHSQMVQDGQYRGGSLPYGYKLEHQGRTNKKNQEVRDLMIDEDEAAIVREIFDLLTNHGYGTNRVAQYLNEKGVKTKRGTTLWRGTSIRALIDNPIYIGIYHMQGVQSAPFEHLRIIDDNLFQRCQQTVKGRSTKNFGEEAVVFRTDTRSLLSGIIYCGHCGCRLCFNHHHEERKLAGGGTGVYDYETYRCYRKISSKKTCQGQTVYKALALNQAVEQQVKIFLSKIESVPRERLMELASARNEETYKVAFKQAQKDFENAEKQVTALEEEAVKALTGESQLDLSVVNSMLVKHRAKLEAAHTTMEEAQTRMQAEKENAKETKAQIDELLSWAECFEKADIGTKHLIVARLVERVDVSSGYKVHIKFRISLKQFLGQE